MIFIGLPALVLFDQSLGAEDNQLLEVECLADGAYVREGFSDLVGFGDGVTSQLGWHAI